MDVWFFQLCFKKYQETSSLSKEEMNYIVRCNWTWSNHIVKNSESPVEIRPSDLSVWLYVKGNNKSKKDKNECSTSMALQKKTMFILLRTGDRRVGPGLGRFRVGSGSKFFRTRRSPPHKKDQIWLDFYKITFKILW
jgi:hypothetical protein